MTGVLIREKKESSDTQGEYCMKTKRLLKKKKKDKEAADASASQGLPRVVHSHQQLGDEA